MYKSSLSCQVLADSFPVRQRLNDVLGRMNNDDFGPLMFSGSFPRRASSVLIEAHPVGESVSLELQGSAGLVVFLALSVALLPDAVGVAFGTPLARCGNISQPVGVGVGLVEVEGLFRAAPGLELELLTTFRNRGQCSGGDTSC